jgi:hypothetical protein
VGLFALARKPGVRPFRFFAVCWVVLVLIFEATGGKPYYLIGLLPVLVSAGALEVDAWLSRGRRTRRQTTLIGAVSASALVSAVIALPILPVGDAGPAVAMNSDIGETIGWPQFVREVAAIHARVPRPTVILTENYGEAGAIDRFGAPYGLPSAYSGHNGFGEWGPPAGRERSIIAVGIRWTVLRTYFDGCRPVARISNSAGIDNEENGTTVAVCLQPREPWTLVWPHLKHLS